MSSEVPPIARIPLARSPLRLFALPALLVLAAVGLVILAVAGPLRMGDAGWYAALAIAGLLALVAVVIAVRLLSIRLDVEEAAVHLHWLGGGRRYLLAPGPVTRVRLRGENASRLRARSRWLGWGLGRARLRDEEDVEVVRLARTATVILVPTERGRLAIAASSEDDLIDALSRAARARQRLEQLAATAPSTTVGAPMVEAGPAAEPDAPEPLPEPEPHVLTGIERALREERLAREREEAEAAATLPVPAAALPESQALPAGTDASAAPARRARLRARGRGIPRVGRPRPSAAFVLVPLIGAGIVWGAATALGRLPDPTSDLGRLTSLALVLAGPATSVGAIMARAWWPRVVGVVVTSGLAASVFIGRALLGA